MTKLSPDQEVNIVAMREAGYTHAVIAERNGCSIATVKRACSRHGATKGAIAAEALSQARANLRKSISGNDAIQEIAASVVLDTQFHVELLREKLGEAANKLEINSTEDSKQAFRSLNSYANALKLSADAMRSALKIDTSDAYIEQDLPVLTIQTLTEEDVAEMRRQQEAEELELYGSDIEEEDSIVEYH